ncbi:hypothetical protein FRC02_008742 [Tulasnella sp. 418]|nr:hypothetical protein FRC02_008742 [Tulasnella sp. 418]
MTGTSSTAPLVAFKSKEVGDHDSAHNTENAVNSIEGRASNSKQSQFSVAEGTAERWETLDEAKRAKKNVLETSKRLGLKGGKGNKKEKRITLIKSSAGKEI